MFNPFSFLWRWWSRPAPSPATNLQATLRRTHHHHRRKGIWRRDTMTIATLRWKDPSTRVDGSPLAAGDIGSVSIRDITSDGVETEIGSVLSGVQSFTTGVLSVGDHAFSVVVHDTAGHSSVRSNVAAVTVVATLAAPSPATELVAELSS